MVSIGIILVIFVDLLMGWIKVNLMCFVICEIRCLVVGVVRICFCKSVLMFLKFYSCCKVCFLN